MRPAAALRRLARIERRDRMALAEAAAWLALASLAIALVPFRRLMRVVASAPPARRDADAATVARVRWAVEACARRLPWKTLCFQQGLAADRMLARRGIARTLFYGVRTDEAGRLVAHVWVRAGSLDVVGCEAAAPFVPLASFPSA